MTNPSRIPSRTNQKTTLRTAENVSTNFIEIPPFSSRLSDIADMIDDHRGDRAGALTFVTPVVRHLAHYRRPGCRRM